MIIISRINQVNDIFLQGIQLLETCRVQDATEEKKMNDTLLLLYMNASLCSLKLGQGARAKTFGRKVIF
jgi:hypothetical protein